MSYPTITFRPQKDSSKTQEEGTQAWKDLLSSAMSEGKDIVIVGADGAPKEILRYTKDGHVRLRLPLLSGEVMFEMFTTYGIPPEIQEEMLQKYLDEQIPRS